MSYFSTGGGTKFMDRRKSGHSIVHSITSSAIAVTPEGIGSPSAIVALTPEISSPRRPFKLKTAETGGLSFCRLGGFEVDD
jgi:uridine phosphorylase